MRKVVTYEEFKKYAKVGMEVRAVPGHLNACNELGLCNTSASGVGVVTCVTADSFKINDCPHTYSRDYSLWFEIKEKTLDNLEVDDVVVSDNGSEYTVVAVAGRLLFLEDKNGHYFNVATIKQLKDNDWTVKQPDAQELTEVTLAEVAKKLGIDVDKLRIKE